jgi:hypothetical protein
MKLDMNYPLLKKLMKKESKNRGNRVSGGNNVSHEEFTVGRKPIVSIECAGLHRRCTRSRSPGCARSLRWRWEETVLAGRHRTVAGTRRSRLMRAPPRWPTLPRELARAAAPMSSLAGRSVSLAAAQDPRRRSSRSLACPQPRSV